MVIENLSGVYCLKKKNFTDSSTIFKMINCAAYFELKFVQNLN
ncbi:hypothetical protein SASC598O11_010290 [Snodgrassella alvi SCGC AB-598-O11]|nr:hypothetical protein SASC598O11_010290 [Snodgrassella alvi SCGC AB-598-O11]